MDNRLVHRDDNVTYRASAEHSFFDDRCFEKTWHKAIVGEVNLALIRRLKPSKLSGKQNFLRANPSQQTPRTYEAPINKKQGFKGIKKKGIKKRPSSRLASRKNASILPMVSRVIQS